MRSGSEWDRVNSSVVGYCRSHWFHILWEGWRIFNKSCLMAATSSSEKFLKEFLLHKPLAVPE